MEARISRNNLLTVLNRCVGVVPPKGPIVHVTNFLIESRENAVIATGTDLGNTITCAVEADVVSEGKAVVNAKKLMDIVRELSGEEIHLVSQENYSLNLQCACGKFMMAGLNPDEFPAAPEFEKEQTATIKGQDLSGMIRRILFAVSSPDLSLLTSGALLSIGENKLTLVGTDGHRLAWVRRSLQTEIVDHSVMVSKKVLVELKKIADDFSDSDLELGFSGSFLICTIENTVLYGRLNEEEFPDYRSVIPESPEKRIVIPSEPFTRSLRRVSLLTDDQSHGVRLLFRDNLLTVKSQDSDYGDATETIEINQVEEEVKLVFNAAYVLEFLGVADTDEISISLNSELAPCAFQLMGDDQYICVIMPLQTD
ncbi:MAG: DNA polymerase III subunit beta [bacterium]